MSNSIVLSCFALAVLGCGSGDSNALKHVSAAGTTCCLVTDGNQHAAYLLNAPTAIGSTGELHVTTADGTDVKVATGVASGGFAFPPKGGPSAILWVTLSTGGKDASLSWLDLSKPGQQPKVLFAGGMRLQNITPGLSSSPNWTLPVLQQGFFTPSGKYFVVGVLTPNVANSPDLHTIDMATGNDVFVRPNGAFDYLEAALPDDTMLFQDSVGGNMGVAGPPPVDTLFWISLPKAGSTQPQVIDTRTGNITISADNKTVVYQRVDRGLYAWDPATHPATGTKLAADALAFGVGGGKVGYIAADRSFHVVGADGSPLVTVAAATAAADPFSPVYVAPDGADAYWFGSVETQNARGTLMHVATAAGATANKIADHASLVDVRPLPGALLFMQNVDAVGQFGDAVRAARDGSGAVALATTAPVGGLVPVSPPMPIPPTTWVCPHLGSATMDKDRRFIDTAAPAPAGALSLTTMAGGGAAPIDPSVRAAQFAVSDDLAELVYIGGGALDGAINNYAGSLKHVPIATPAMTSMPLLSGVSELGLVVGKKLFVNAPKAATPGVYFVKF